MERDKKLWTYFRNCDLAVDGSPMMQTLMSPLGGGGGKWEAAAE
jgi:hypothetical protein